MPERDIKARDLGLMKSGRPFANKPPDKAITELIALVTNHSNKVYAFSVDDHKPINAETLRRNFQKFGPINSYGFRNSFKTWCLNQEPPNDAFLFDQYVDHALAP